MWELADPGGQDVVYEARKVWIWRAMMLTGIKVVECGQGVAAAFAAKLFALLGAEVIKVEPPQGDVTRFRGPFRADTPDPELSGMFIYLNAGKLGVTLDLTTAQGRE